MKTYKFTSIDDYISQQPADIQPLLQQIRTTIKAAAPLATETIKYDMPTFMHHGNLVYFAAFKNHIGFYSAPTDEPAFIEALSPYKTGKGSVQFPYTRPIPYDLITRIVLYRISKNEEKHIKK